MLSWAPAALSDLSGFRHWRETEEQKVYGTYFHIRAVLLRSAEHFIIHFQGIDWEAKMQSFTNDGGTVCGTNWNRVWGHTSQAAASDLHKGTRVITNRCHISFSIKVIKWVEIPKDEVFEVCAWGYIAQLPAISEEGELCTGNELWPPKFSLIIASKSIMCALHQIITGLLFLFLTCYLGLLAWKIKLSYLVLEEFLPLPLLYLGIYHWSE